MNSDNEQRILRVFTKCLNLTGTIDKESLIYNQTEGWDSVGHMTIVAELETEFDCMLDTDDILDLSDFGKALEIMEKYG